MKSHTSFLKTGSHGIFEYKNFQLSWKGELIVGGLNSLVECLPSEAMGSVLSTQNNIK